MKIIVIDVSVIIITTGTKTISNVIIKIIVAIVVIELVITITTTVEKIIIGIIIIFKLNYLY